MSDSLEIGRLDNVNRFVSTCFSGHIWSSDVRPSDCGDRPRAHFQDWHTSSKKRSSRAGIDAQSFSSRAAKTISGSAGWSPRYPMSLLRLSITVPCRGRGGNICAGFTSRRNVLSTTVLEYVLRPCNFFRSVAMDREKNATFFDSSFVPLRLILGNTHTDQGPDQTTYRAAYSEAGQSTHDRACGNEWTNAGDRERTDSRQQAQSPTDHSARRYAGGCSLRRFGILLVGKVFCA